MKIHVFFGRKYQQNDICTYHLKILSQQAVCRYVKKIFVENPICYLLKPVCYVWYFHQVEGFRDRFAKRQILQTMYVQQSCEKFLTKQICSELLVWVSSYYITSKIKDRGVLRSVFSQKHELRCSVRLSFELSWTFLFFSKKVSNEMIFSRATLKTCHKLLAGTYKRLCLSVSFWLSLSLSVHLPLFLPNAVWVRMAKYGFVWVSMN